MFPLLDIEFSLEGILFLGKTRNKNVVVRLSVEGEYRAMKSLTRELG